MAGVAKLADRAGSRRTVIDFGVPTPLAAPLAILLPLAELAVQGTQTPCTPQKPLFSMVLKQVQSGLSSQPATSLPH